MEQDDIGVILDAFQDGAQGRNRDAQPAGAVGEAERPASGDKIGERAQFQGGLRIQGVIVQFSL